MANKHWYVLKVRPGFAAVVTQRLRKLNLAVSLPGARSIRSKEPHSQAGGYLYCLFDLQDRESVTIIPGVLDILGIPEPIPIDEDLPPL
jgi:hypothetical protein